MLIFLSLVTEIQKVLTLSLLKVIFATDEWFAPARNLLKVKCLSVNIHVLFFSSICY